MTARALAALALVIVAAPATAEPIAIVGARVHVRPGQTLDGATVVIDRGRVIAVGAGVAAPAGARIIDGAGKVVTAGLIEPVSGVGLVGVDLEGRSVDGRHGPLDALHADAIQAAYQARDGFAPRAVTVAVARSGGLTLVVAAPAGGLVAGQSAAFALDGSVEPVRAPVAMHAALGPGGAGAVAGSRGRAIAALRELLDDARAFGRDRAAYERNQRRAMIADRLDLEALQPVLRGAVPLVVTAHAEADVRAAVRVAQEFGVRLVIAGGAEAWRAADLLAKVKVPVILDPTANLPEQLDATDVRDDAAAVLAAAGVAVAVSTLGGASTARTLRQLAGVAVGNGLPWDQALAAVTTVPATIFGLAGRGTVAAGSVADVVVWSGDPLELASAAEVVIIGGVVQPTQSHQTRLLDRYRRLPPAP
ncbi:MAG: amidohydrolase family protein [Myxococcales bacterium]|nr:amidohydrolase family protein [Myxococcales bacterium]